MNHRMIFRSLLLLLGACVVCAPCACAQRVLELSSKTGVMFLSVDFMDSSGKVLKSGEVKGRGYEWFEVPSSGVSFKLKGLGVPTKPIQLEKNENTFVSVITKLPTEFEFSEESGIVAKSPKAEQRAPVGSTGYVFVGRLDGKGDDSQWKSIYLAGNNGRRLDQDGTPPLTYEMFKEMALAENTVLTVDFPLNLREEIGGEGAVKDVVRSGQKIVISGISEPDSTIIYAKVTVIEPVEK